ncbi:MAG: amino acid adenylation domain-containing protein [Bacteroidota bacterium]
MIQNQVKIDELTDRQRALLVLRARQRQAAQGREANAGIVRQQRVEGEGFPLSFAQQRLWFLYRLDPANPAYNLPLNVRLVGDLDVAALEGSLQAVVARHETLRTTFSEDDEGRAQQVVAPDASVPLAHIDIQGLPGSQRAEEAKRWEQAEAHRCFRLETDVPLRACLLQEGPQAWQLLVTMHHIASDGWSMELLLREVIGGYRKHVGLPHQRLPELDVQYADYAVWQRQDRLGETARQEQYWQTQLEGAAPLLAMPTDRPRPPVQQFEGGWVPVKIPASLSASLAALVSHSGATPFVGFLAAFVAMLSRWSEQDDITVGTPVSGRTRSEIEGLIGFFVNTLVLRCRTDATATFRDLVQVVRTTMLEADAHQDVPFDRLVDLLGVERDLSRHPLFQVVFSYGQHGSTPGGTYDEVAPSLRLASEQQSVNTGTAKFDLTLALYHRDGQVQGVFEYSRALFDEATIQSMADSFLTLLGACVADPDCVVAEIPAAKLPPSGWSIEGAQPVVEPTSPATLPALFEQQVAQKPDAIALTVGTEHVSYAALETVSNTLARRLQEAGVGPDDAVGLRLTRTPAMVMGILAAVKAGGAYVPIDPEYPVARQRLMEEDARLKLLVTEEACAARSSESPVERLWIEPSEVKDILRAGEDPGPPRRALSDDHLAYIVYTSGSTGKPRGVMVTHAGIVNQLRWRQRVFDLGPGDAVLHNFSFSFDPSVWMFFWPLASGGRICLSPPGEARDLEALVDMAARDRCAVLGTGPSVLDMLLDVPELAQCTALRHIFCGGELFLQELKERYFSALPASLESLPVHNVYGPTETVIDATWHTCHPDDERTSIPIGRAVDWKGLLVLDRFGNPAPVGMPGELYIGGAGLARGYRSKPRLTAERFVPSSWPGATGERLYRTGDVVRHLPSQEVEFVGRVDAQVKVRGYRVEPGEIEEALLNHDAVREVAVVPVGGPSRQQLAAYVLPKDPDAPPDAAVLRTALRAALPEYMVPQFFVIRTTFPRTPSDKLDRKALPPPDPNDALPDEMVVPRNDVEYRLCAVWSSVLGLEEIGVNANFFDLGGDSILCIQLVAHARKAGIRFTPLQLFQHQTVGELAEVVEAGAVEIASTGPVTGTAPLTPFQARYFERSWAAPAGWVLSALCETPTTLTAGDLSSVMSDLTSAHDGLRARFPVVNGTRRQEIGAALDEPLTVVDLSALPPPARARALAAALQRGTGSLDIGQGPLFRSIYFQQGDERGRLMLIMHRLVTDGFSWQVLQEDMKVLYSAVRSGTQAPPAMKTTSVLDWGTRLQALEPSKEAAAYWLDRLGEVTDVLPARLMATEPDSAARTHASTATATRWLDPTTTRQLFDLVSRSYRLRGQEVLVAGIALALRRWGGLKRWWVDVETNGRTHAFDGVDLSRTVGAFADQYPLWVSLPDEGTPEEALTLFSQEAAPQPEEVMAYSVARYVHPASTTGQALRALPQPEIAFSYLGEVPLPPDGEEDFPPAPETLPPEHDADNERTHVLELMGHQLDGELCLRISYSRARFSEDAIAGLQDALDTALRDLVRHCESAEAGLPFTYEDLTLVDLDEGDFDKISALLV